ncbi:hypothetical protein [Pseudarthrobacter sp. S9]|uniref:hypothetical protein n=1 Tax=Pseudarthrobacter sp. S9 TaxID=3418421 RepID=UPI003CFF45A9
MLLNVEAKPLVRQAKSAAIRAANQARVQIVDEHEIGRLRDMAELFIEVWGTSQREAPMPSDLLRSLSHAGCNVTAAYDATGTLSGAAVAVVSPGSTSMYSMIAGVAPGAADSGIGFALKQHQRAWGLARDLDTMTWTFDPLVSRNARFNLTKLGAHATDYLRNFYGVMDDEINANDESDRLVAVWPLATDRAVACSEGFVAPVELPHFTPDDIRATGADGQPMLIEAAGSLWCRVPEDIVALRRRDPDEGAAWRSRIREVLTTAFASGHTANSVTRAGWYRLEKESQK